ncbi:hypothetical protein BAE44_0010049 [Dichanthelium oligosanthes]|uniref:Cellulose synthase n=1 Tax=Dichanthelium oligosanthes TaxID=888268 RepID=A0A1E5VUX4_9POAL|nr:hypothetical protein BAE44_0010049 [Dichanthelium oligosanthes]
MEASAGLVAGSHNRNELVVIRRDGEPGPKPLNQQNGRVCQICGDDVGLNPDGEPFVACNECAFPICRDCYEYERREGTQNCPQCKTRFKRLKGKSLPRNAARRFCRSLVSAAHVDDIPPEQHALVPSFMGGGGKRIHPLPYADPNLPVQPRSMDPSKDLAAYGYGSVAWKERMESWKQKQERMHQMRNDGGGNDDGDDADLPLMDEARQPLSRKIPLPSSQINPYRMIIIIRLVVLGFFFHYRVMHPVPDAFALWLISVICEIWFAMSWILDQFPKWFPIERETYLDRLSLRFDKEGQPSQLAPVDFFVSTVDPLKEPPLVTANTVLSILAVDYPVDKVSCYVSDDGAAMLTFEALSETSEFAKKWVPFCKRYCLEPRAPEWYFQQKIDYLKDKVAQNFVRERRAMKREYEEFKVRINALVAKAQKVPEEGWTMQDGTPWPGNNVRDHPGMIQVFLGQSGGHDVEGNELPRLVYVSREKRPGYNHHKKAGAMNALVRVSAVLTNAPYLLNLDCDHYINNSKAIKEAMCFMMDPLLGKKVCYVQFPQRKTKKKTKTSKPKFEKIKKLFKKKENQAPAYALGEIDEAAPGAENEKASIVNQQKLEKKFGQSSVFVASTLLENGGTLKSASPASLLKEAIHVISCGYEDKTDWGKDIGWIYGSVTEDILTGFKMHCHGWRSIYCIPKRAAFKGSAPLNLSDRLHQLNNVASLWFMSLFICIFATSILEMRWSGVGIDDWWRNEQFWVIGGVSSHLFAVFQGLLKVIAGIDTSFTVTSKGGDDEDFSELYTFKWTTLLIPPTTLLLLNFIGVVAGVSNAINNGYESWGPLFGKLFFAFWVIVHLYPFLKGLVGRQNRTPTIVIVWSILLASIFSLLWVRIDPFLAKNDGPLLEECGLDCN